MTTIVYQNNMLFADKQSTEKTGKVYGKMKFDMVKIHDVSKNKNTFHGDEILVVGIAGMANSIDYISKVTEMEMSQLPEESFVWTRPVLFVKDKFNNSVIYVCVQYVYVVSYRDGVVVKFTKHKKHETVATGSGMYEAIGKNGFKAIERAMLCDEHTGGYEINYWDGAEVKSKSIKGLLAKFAMFGKKCQNAKLQKELVQQAV